VASAAAKLKASGSKCPLTTSWMSWTQLESFSAWHNVEFATKNNGFGGLDARLAFNTPLHLRHIENLANMAKQGLFVYKGRGNASDATFVSGECAMTTASSSIYGDVKKRPALLPRRARRAAEHHHRRRQPLGDGGQEAGRVQGRGQVLRVPGPGRRGV
jgi:ABC-type glycerol-3-phosphate transport system substrate-binding protein